MVLLLSTCSRSAGNIKQYHMVDPWKHLSDWDKPANLSDEVFERLLQTVRDRTRFASEKTIVHRGRTTEVIDDIADHSLDFAYIDGDHSLRGICIDLIKSYSKVKSKGFIAGDDCIADSFVQHGAKFEPTLVFPFVAYFAEAMGHEICFLPHNQFLINKSTKRFRIIDMAGTYGDVSLRRQLALINMLKRNVPVPIRKAVRSIRTWARRVS
jgi:hypothetical protein